MWLMQKQSKSVGAPRKSEGAADEDVRLAIVVPGTLRDEALRKAQSEDLSLSQVIRSLLRQYVSGKIKA